MAEIDRNLLEKISNDRALGSALLFAHRHPEASAPMHTEIMDLWRSADPFVLIEAFREAGKSTLSEEFLVMEGCFGNFNYCLLIGETYAKACQRLESIANECLRNTRLHALFGGKVLARKSIENRVWFRAGGMVEAVGWEQELQSFKYLDHRPDRAYLDDPENLERVRDTAAVDASMKKLFLELIPAMDKQRRKIRLTQTRRAQDCMVTRLSSNPEWVYRAFPICNGDIDAPSTRALWPERYPLDWIRSERDSYRGAGMLGEFLQAYMLQATDPATKPFREENIRAVDAAPWQWMPKYAIYDPARTVNPEKSDQAGKVVVSRFGAKILVHESGGYYWKPDAFVRDLFDTNEAHGPAALGVEKNSLDDWLMQPIQIEMMRRGVVLPLKSLQAPQDRNKLTFILGLQPFFEAGDIVLVGGKSAHPQLVAEILNFPQGSLNILNALAYSLRMFSGQPIYEDFGAENVGETPDARFGETIYLAFNGTPSETVVACLQKRERSMYVSRDFSATGAPLDAVKYLVGEIRASFPTAKFSVWVPAETYDQWQRVPLVPALRASSLTPYRAEHIAVARGCLSDRIRTVIRNRRLFMVDPAARLSANAFAAGYCRPVGRGGEITQEPENGVSKLVAEAIETLTASLSSALNDGASVATNATNAQGVPYRSALPRR